MLHLVKKLDYLCNCKSEISNVCNTLEGHCLEAMKIVHHHASDCFDWLTSEHKGVNPSREAISILSEKCKRFTRVHPVCLNKTFLYVYTCIDQNAYNKVSDTFIDYKKKLKLNFLVLENNDAIIQLSWGIEGDG